MWPVFWLKFRNRANDGEKNLEEGFTELAMKMQLPGNNHITARAVS
jgi:hypothetical protein